MVSYQDLINDAYILMEYIEFATTGNAIDFGNLTGAKYANTGAASNGHGGL